MQNDRAQQLERRKRSGLRTVSLVGYTNAGKSSLFNTLTGKHTLVENVLFATLDSIAGKLYIPELKNEILVTDTIGFIRDLPPHLIRAFTSTLMESIHAEVLLHVIDASDPDVDSKIQVVSNILRDLGVSPQMVLYVFNKSDKTAPVQKKRLLEQYDSYRPVFVSATSGEGVSNVKQAVADRLL